MFTPNAYGMFSMPTLETKRLILRRIAMRDAGDIFAYSKDKRWRAMCSGARRRNSPRRRITAGS